MTEEQKKLQAEHEKKYMKYLKDLEDMDLEEPCVGSCSTCGKDCAGRTEDQKTPKLAKRIVAVCSGKGGTGKSLITCLLAEKLQKLGLKTAVLDADLENPCIPYLFGNTDPCASDDANIYPVTTASGIEFISMASVEQKHDQPLLSYGKDIAVGALYFYTNVKWSDGLDIMLIDMPSGVGDVPLQLCTIIPFDGAVVVSNPSELCDAMAIRTVNLMKMVLIPVLGIIENKTVLPCASCGSATVLGGGVESHIKTLGAPLMAEVPFKPELSVMADFGRIADADVPELDETAKYLGQVK